MNGVVGTCGGGVYGFFPRCKIEGVVRAYVRQIGRMVTNAVVRDDQNAVRRVTKHVVQNGRLRYDVVDPGTTHGVHLKVEFGRERLIAIQTPNGITRNASIEVVRQSLVRRKVFVATRAKHHTLTYQWHEENNGLK